ncbi:uncharacterized protein B0H18DRAFT_1126890 [Fomitopsis serialis]|uniref:uncharacterized protein n=1 Tax=Fomitopsis serialis TaxID=139415 RepID=UPI0020079397|nr:uncharacterized protein B0H18DRAFT_1126890 [Neoantrodia serialis]KAH9912715.1 hypothetical protein B0H18DRAFT_1126890 [Neoantrodia serialis]
MTDASPERKASTSSRKSKDTDAGQRSNTPGASVDSSLLTPMVKCSGGTPQCDRCEKRGVKCEYIPIHVQRQQTAAAAAGGIAINIAVAAIDAHALAAIGASAVWSHHATLPGPIYDWPEYYDMSAEMLPDSRRQTLPHSAPSYLGPDPFNQSQAGPSYDRYHGYEHGVPNSQHYPGSVAHTYASSPGSSGSAAGQALGLTLPTGNTSQLMSGVNQSTSYPNQYLQGQGYYNEPSGATAFHGQNLQGWMDPNDMNYSAFQDDAFKWTVPKYFLPAISRLAEPTLDAKA